MCGRSSTVPHGNAQKCRWAVVCLAVSLLFPGLSFSKEVTVQNKVGCLFLDKVDVNRKRLQSHTHEMRGFECEVSPHRLRHLNIWYKWVALFGED